VQEAGTRPDQEMGVVREERPGGDGEGAVRRQGRQVTKSVRSVSSLKMARRSRPRTITWWRVPRIEAGLARHGEGDATSRRFQKHRNMKPLMGMQLERGRG
jgi:hypothetical protein